MAGTNLLYHFPFLFLIISDVAAGHYVLEEAVDSARFRQFLVDPSIVARVVHFWLASFAVTGATLMLFSNKGEAEEAKDRKRYSIWGARLALAVTVCQLPVGLWVLSQLPRAAQQNVLGGDLVAPMAWAATKAGRLRAFAPGCSPKRPGR